MHQNIKRKTVLNIALSSFTVYIQHRGKVKEKVGEKYLKHNDVLVENILLHSN